MDFGTLKTRIEALIGRAPADVCYELTTADINQEMRLRVMEATTTIAEAETISLPSDFLELVSVYRDVDPRTTLRVTTPQNLHKGHQTSGTPGQYAIEDGLIRFSPAPSASENVVIRYYAKLADLSADSDTNDVLDKYPSIYVYGVLAHHAALIRDNEAAATWYAAYEKAKKQARNDDRAYRYGGDTLSIRTAYSA